ncbi:MAG: HAD family hydrolase [Clostridia bacterium]|nr:HAD family hydrolase [Clostridia bacterium]
MKYSACVFDLDGTLLNTLEDLKNSVNYALKIKNYPQRTVEEVRSFVGNGIPMLIKRAVPQGTAESDTQETLRIFKEHYSVHLNDNTKPYDGICELLEYLKQKGIRTAVVTNKAHLAANELIKGFFGELITLTVGQKDGVPTKPDPTSLFEAVKSLGCDGKDVLYVGDSDVDVFTAHNGNLKCVGVTWGFRSRESLLSAGADFIADTPQEIIRIIG